MVAYEVLRGTALAFISSLSLMPNTTTTDEVRFDMAKIRAVRAPNYTHTFGHNYFVSQSPPLQGTSDLDGFMTRVASMSLKLESETNQVLSVAVDKEQRSAVARVAYQMKAPGQAPVENDLVWWLWMDAEGKKVEKSMEFVDPVATKELQARMAASASAGTKC
jgi:ketosteroid isomerase-like protein